jgi:hypothetical protein
MKSRELLELLIGPSSEEIDRIVRLVQGSRTWQEANRKIERFGIVFANDNPDLISTGAIGGYNPETNRVELNAAHFPIRPEGRLRTAIEHELMHRDQMQRAQERGGNPTEIVRRKLNAYIQGGVVNAEKYGRDPLEMQALARNAVSMARAKGLNPKKLMRAGELYRYAPLTPLDLKRFHKYAYRMAERLLGETLVPTTHRQR